MNCPTRVDPEALGNGWNQNPNHLAADTNNDNSGLANRRARRDHKLRIDSTLKDEGVEDHVARVSPNDNEASLRCRGRARGGDDVEQQQLEEEKEQDGGGSSSKEKRKENATTTTAVMVQEERGDQQPDGGGRNGPKMPLWSKKLWAVLKKFGSFVGPGFMIAVAYIDPGNYATDVSAGAAYQYKLLVMVLVSSVIAVFLQSLCIKLGSATGMNLAQCIKAHCPAWLNYMLWFFAEAAIIATDIAEVIGTAIALNLLIKVPVVAGCAISIVDVLIILLFYRPSGSMRGLRLFEYFVAALVLGVVICFSIELSLIRVPDVGELFRGFLPSSTLVKGGGLYQACGILGATVMPHSLYLGSGIVQPRLLEYDRAHGLAPPAASKSLASDTSDTHDYRPSVRAIKACMSYSIVELVVALFTFALFVNSAILIVAGASLHTQPGASTATLFQIHDLLSSTIAPAAGVIFGLALLLSGTSAGIICTIAGQMVAEGQLVWHIKPWVRRLMTRSISITPSIIIAGAIGDQGLSTALEASQVALSIILPFTSAPLIYFTCRDRYMTVIDQPPSSSSSSDDAGGGGVLVQLPSSSSSPSSMPGAERSASGAAAAAEADVDADAEAGHAPPAGQLSAVVVTTTKTTKTTTTTPVPQFKLTNHWITAVFAVLMWIIIVIMNVAALVFLGLGDG